MPRYNKHGEVEAIDENDARKITGAVNEGRDLIEGVHYPWAKSIITAMVQREYSDKLHRLIENSAYSPILDPNGKNIEYSEIYPENYKD